MRVLKIFVLAGVVFTASLALSLLKTEKSYAAYNCTPGSTGYCDGSPPGGICNDPSLWTYTIFESTGATTIDATATNTHTVSLNTYDMVCDGSAYLLGQNDFVTNARFVNSSGTSYTVNSKTITYSGGGWQSKELCAGSFLVINHLGECNKTGSGTISEQSNTQTVSFDLTGLTSLPVGDTRLCLTFDRTTFRYFVEDPSIVQPLATSAAYGSAGAPCVTIRRGTTVPKCPAGTDHAGEPYPGGDVNRCNDPDVCSPSHPELCPVITRDGAIESYCGDGSNAGSTYGDVPDLNAGTVKVRFAYVSNGSTFTESIVNVDSSGHWGMPTPGIISSSYQHFYVEAYERGEQSTGLDLGNPNYNYKVASDGVRLYPGGRSAPCSDPPPVTCQQLGTCCPDGTPFDTYGRCPCPSGAPRLPDGTCPRNENGNIRFNCDTGFTITPGSTPFDINSGGGMVNFYQKDTGSPAGSAYPDVAWAASSAIPSAGIFVVTGTDTWNGYSDSTPIPKDGKRYVVLIFANGWAYHHTGLTIPPYSFSDGTYWDPSYGQTQKLSYATTFISDVVQMEFVCGQTDYFDLDPATLAPTLTDDSTGHSFIHYNHSITNDCTATKDLDTTVAVRIHVTLGPGGPDIVAPVASSLNSLAICASTPPNAYDSPADGIDVGAQPPGTLICTHITVNPGTNRSGVPQGLRSSYPPPHCAQVTAKPFIKAYGAEVRAGGGFAPACTVSDPGAGAINTYANGTGANYYGSSAQFGVMALLNIRGFYSASLRTSAPTPPKGLSFSNTAGSATFGGAFADAGLCITDYVGTTQDIAANQIAYTGVGSLVNGKKQYTLAANSTLGALTVSAGKQAAIYVNGDLFINGNITLGSAATLKDMPFLAVIAQGNIYIGANVTRLDGLYIAQPRPADAATKGRIYTCAIGINSLYNGATLDGGCSTQLVVNGGLVAQRIKFLRTIDSLTDDTGQVPNFADGTGTRAAEVVNASPEMWLAPSPFIDTATGTGKYDAIYSLPPVY